MESRNLVKIYLRRNVVVLTKSSYRTSSVFCSDGFNAEHKHVQSTKNNQQTSAAQTTRRELPTPPETPPSGPGSEEQK